jgi:hypothetical protein
MEGVFDLVIRTASDKLWLIDWKRNQNAKARPMPPLDHTFDKNIYRSSSLTKT